MSYVVFSTTAYHYMVETLCKLPGFEKGDLGVEVFPEGEKHFTLGKSVKDKNVILIGGTISESNTLELYDIATGLVDYGCGALTIYIPYFGYSTQERVIHKGDIVVAKGRARLLSTIRSARFNNKIVLLDLHTPGIAHYFEGSVHCRHLSAKSMVHGIIKKINDPANTVVASTDAGGAKWVEALANESSIEAAFVYKKRISNTKTTVSGINADVHGKTVVLYDDMIRSGSSFIQAAEAYKKSGAKSIIGAASHCVFHPNTLSLLKAAGIFEEIHLTNSHPLALEAQKQAPDFIKLFDVVRLFADKLE